MWCLSALRKRPRRRSCCRLFPRISGSPPGDCHPSAKSSAAHQTLPLLDSQPWPAGGTLARTPARALRREKSALPQAGHIVGPSSAKCKQPGEPLAKAAWLEDEDCVFKEFCHLRRKAAAGIPSHPSIAGHAVPCDCWDSWILAWTVQGIHILKLNSIRMRLRASNKSSSAAAKH